MVEPMNVTLSLGTAISIGVIVYLLIGVMMARGLRSSFVTRETKYQSDMFWSGVIILGWLPGFICLATGFVLFLLVLADAEK